MENENQLITEAPPIDMNNIKAKAATQAFEKSGFNFGTTEGMAQLGDSLRDNFDKTRESIFGGNNGNSAPPSTAEELQNLNEALAETYGQPDISHISAEITPVSPVDSPSSEPAQEIAANENQSQPQIQIETQLPPETKNSNIEQGNSAPSKVWEWKDLDRLSVSKTGEPLPMPSGFETWASDIKQEWMDRKHRELEGGQKPAEQPALNPEVLPKEKEEPIVAEDKPVLEATFENVTPKTLEDDYAELASIREKLAKSTNNKTGTIVNEINLQDLEAEYDNKKEAISERIASEIAQKYGWAKPEDVPWDNKDDENVKKFKAEVNDLLFEKLIKEESLAYKEAIGASKKKSLVDSALQVAKKALDTRGFQWYLGLGQKKRLALNFIAGGAIGVAAGAAASIGLAGYAGLRATRLAGGLTFGAGAKELSNKVWSIEDINAEEAKKIENLKNSSLPLEEQDKAYKEITEEYEKKRRSARLKTLGATVVAGAAGSALAGFAESLVQDTTLGSSGYKHLDNKLPPRRGFGSVESRTDELPVAKEVKSLTAEAAEPALAENLFSDPTVLTPEVKAGDSVWKLIERALDKNPDFNKFSLDQNPAERSNVISYYTDKILKDPSKYDVGKGGEITIGQKPNLTSLFNDKLEFSKVMDNARNLSPRQKLDILTNNKNIEKWISDHPNQQLKNEDLQEILHPKAKVGVDLSQKTPEILEGEKAEVSFPEENVKVEPQEALEQSRLSSIPKPEVDDGALHQEIQEQMQKAAIEKAEGASVKENGIKSTDQLRTFKGDADFVNQVEGSFKRAINSIYGKKGFMGIGGREGVDTVEWKEISKLPAKEVLGYYKDPEHSNLHPKIFESLSKSVKHRNLVEKVVDLVENKTQGDIRPFENNETMEAFIKRLGGYIMRGPSGGVA